MITEKLAVFPKTPSHDHLRLHLGEMTADEARIAAAAYRLALVESRPAPVTPDQPVSVQCPSCLHAWIQPNPFTQPVTPAGGEVVRGEATGDTTTFKDAWARLSPIDRSVISIYFQETHPPVSDAAIQNAENYLRSFLSQCERENTARCDQADLSRVIAALNQRGGGV